MIRVGCRWDFLPNQPLPNLDEWRGVGFSFVSLRLETFIKYGGPLREFLIECEKTFALRAFSDYLPVASLRSWDEVHQLATKEFLTKHKVSALTCRNPLPQVPPPAQVVRDLLETLPAGTKVCATVRSESGLKSMDGLNGIFVSLQLNDWQKSAIKLSGFAKQIEEVEIELSDAVSVERILESVGEIRLAQNPETLLDITLHWSGDPNQQSKMLESAKSVISRIHQELK